MKSRSELTKVVVTALLVAMVAACGKDNNNNSPAPAASSDSANTSSVTGLSMEALQEHYNAKVLAYIDQKNEIENLQDRVSSARLENGLYKISVPGSIIGGGVLTPYGGYRMVKNSEGVVSSMIDRTQRTAFWIENASQKLATKEADYRIARLGLEIQAKSAGLDKALEKYQIKNGKLTDLVNQYKTAKTDAGRQAIIDKLARAVQQDSTLDKTTKERLAAMYADLKVNSKEFAAKSKLFVKSIPSRTKAFAKSVKNTVVAAAKRSSEFTKHVGRSTSLVVVNDKMASRIEGLAEKMITHRAGLSKATKVAGVLVVGGAIVGTIAWLDHANGEIQASETERNELNASLEKSRQELAQTKKEAQDFYTALQAKGTTMAISPSLAEEVANESIVSRVSGSVSENGTFNSLTTSITGGVSSAVDYVFGGESAPTASKEEVKTEESKPADAAPAAELEVKASETEVKASI